MKNHRGNLLTKLQKKVRLLDYFPYLYINFHYFPYLLYMRTDYIRFLLNYNENVYFLNQKVSTKFVLLIAIHL